MDQRWAPAGAAIAVVTVVAAVALVLSGDDEAGRVATLPAPSAPASASTSASTSDSAEPSPPRDVPAAPPSAPAAPPATPTADPDTPVSSDDEPSPAPAAPPPSKRTAAPPAPPTDSAPKPSPGGPRSSFAFDAAYGTDEPNEVVVQYGDSSSCPHANVRHTVRESADQVVVTLESDAMDPARACTADYRQRLVPVRLQQPLGDRVLVDGSRNEKVAVDRSCNRPFADPPPPKDCTP